MGGEWKVRMVGGIGEAKASSCTRAAESLRNEGKKAAHSCVKAWGARKTEECGAYVPKGGRG